MLDRLRTFLSSSLGQKSLMALTGLALVGFLVAHLAGNLLIFAGDEKFNAYAVALESQGALLYVAEIGLTAVFVVHIALALRTSAQNREARKSRYAIRQTMGRATAGSRSMLVTGAIIGVFLVVHLLDFRLSPEKNAEQLAQMVRARLTEPTGITLYLIGVAAVGLHVSHAVQSALHTLGLHHSRYVALVRNTSIGLALVFFVGFAAFPVFLTAPEPSTEAGLEQVESPTVEPEDAR